MTFEHWLVLVHFQDPNGMRWVMPLRFPKSYRKALVREKAFEYTEMREGFRWVEIDIISVEANATESSYATEPLFV